MILMGPERIGLADATAAALFAGTVSGILDIFAAALINRVQPVKVLRAIASGILGKGAHGGGRGVAIIGFLLQLLMSALIALVYAFASLWLPLLTSHPGWCGMAFGVSVFGVMNGLVVPLSRVPQRPQMTWSWALMNLAVMVGFGSLVAFLIVGWFSAISP